MITSSIFLDRSFTFRTIFCVGILPVQRFWIVCAFLLPELHLITKSRSVSFSVAIKAEPITAGALHEGSSDHIRSDSISTSSLRTPFDSSITILHKGFGYKTKVAIISRCINNLTNCSFIYNKIAFYVCEGKQRMTSEFLFKSNRTLRKNFPLLLAAQQSP